LVRIVNSNISVIAISQLLMLIVPCCSLGRGPGDASSSHWSFPSETAFQMDSSCYQQGNH
jgi:hypothetical protein